MGFLKELALTVAQEVTRETSEQPQKKGKPSWGAVAKVTLARELAKAITEEGDHDEGDPGMSASLLRGLTDTARTAAGEEGINLGAMVYAELFGESEPEPPKQKGAIRRNVEKVTGIPGTLVSGTLDLAKDAAEGKVTGMREKASLRREVGLEEYKQRLIAAVNHKVDDRVNEYHARTEAKQAERLAFKAQHGVTPEMAEELAKQAKKRKRKARVKQVFNGLFRRGRGPVEADQGGEPDRRTIEHED